MCIECESGTKVARGLCHRCYQRYLWRKKNNPDTWAGWPGERVRRPQKDRRCGYHLSRPAYARDLCRRCYRRMARRGLLEVRL